jgi:hypothetical protein
MDESLDSKQDQLAAFQIVPSTIRKHSPTGVLQYGQQLEMLWLSLSSKLAFHHSNLSKLRLIFLLVQNIATSRSIAIERD